MQQFINCMIEFIIANWQWLAPLVLSLVEFFILFIFRRDKVKIYDKGIYFYISNFIFQAEFKFGKGHGKEKLDFVLDLCKKQFPDFFDRIEFIGHIEWLLSLPEKKKKGGN